MSIPLLVLDIDGEQTLCSPAVGQIVFIEEDQQVISAGHVVAKISILGVSHKLVAPAGTHQRIKLCTAIKLGSALQYQQPLATLKVVDSDEVLDTLGDHAQDATRNCITAPQAGRFYHRPTPDSPAFVQAGESIDAGKTIGLLEVMKTFSPVKWNPLPGNPQTTVVGDYLIADGDDVEDAQPLLDLQND
ncbi:MAG: biotin carboxyl carrier protein [Myxococcota bacterium]|jgi:biotin carboxyl carrier protein